MAFMKEAKQRFDELVQMHFPFEATAETYPDCVAYVDLDKDKRFTYKELDTEMNRLAHAFKADGIQPEDLVMSSLFNSVDHIIVNYAAWKVGAIFSPINFRFAPGNVAHCLEDSKPRVYIYDEELAEVVNQAIELSSFKPEVVISTRDLDSYSSKFPDAKPANPKGITAFHECIRLYTSGTTGRPKGVPHYHADAYIAALTHSLAGMHWIPDDSLLIVAPYFHAAGNIPAYMPAFMRGMKVVSIKRFDPIRVLDAIEAEKLTFLMGPPAAFIAMIDAVKKGYDKDLSSLRGCMLMGAPITRETYRGLRDILKVDVFNGDGTTEALYCHQLSPWDPVEKWEGEATAKNGCPLPGNLLRIVKIYPDKKATPDEVVPKDGKTIGELIVKNIHFPGYYHNNPEQTQAAFRDGWFYTGDNATWDEDGYNHLHGRSGDMILSGGENIYPEGLEAALIEHPAVQDAIVVGLPDPKWGQLVTAYVVLNKGVNVTPEDLDAHMKAHPMVDDYARPRLYSFVDELPYTATGKKQRYILRGKVAEDAKEDKLVRVKKM